MAIPDLTAQQRTDADRGGGGGRNRAHGAPR